MSIPGVDSVSAKICSAAWNRVASSKNAKQSWFLHERFLCDDPLSSFFLFRFVSLFTLCLFALCGYSLRDRFPSRRNRNKGVYMHFLYTFCFSCFPYKNSCFRRFFFSTGNPIPFTPHRGDTHNRSHTPCDLSFLEAGGLSQGFGPSKECQWITKKD